MRGFVQRVSAVGLGGTADVVGDGLGGSWADRVPRTAGVKVLPGPAAAGLAFQTRTIAAQRKAVGRVIGHHGEERQTTVAYSEGQEATEEKRGKPLVEDMC